MKCTRKWQLQGAPPVRRASCIGIGRFDDSYSTRRSALIGPYSPVHYVGGRFVPPRIAEEFGLGDFPYVGVEQTVRIDDRAKPNVQL